MAFRLNFRRAFSDLIMSRRKQRREAGKVKRRTSFLEKLEDRFVLNGQNIEEYEPDFPVR